MDKKFNLSIISSPVRLWLFIGVLMVFVQVVIGGVTRLTDSGLSITEWAVIQGTIPPLNETEWLEAFEQYKKAAKKQYETLHSDMTLSGFKIIYFWEFFHRLWARSIGFVFLFPFLFFFFTKQLPNWLIRRLGIAVALGALAATFGWIMVASGLNDDARTWVSAYKLVIHLMIATILFSHLLWTWFLAKQVKTTDGHFSIYRKVVWFIIGITLLQIIFGGLMAGMRAGLIHPYSSVFIKGNQFWNLLNSSSGIGVESFINYEPSGAIKAIVQLLHRGTAYALLIMISVFVYRLHQENSSIQLRRANLFLVIIIFSQFLLGLLTIINCVGRIPIYYGAMHQAGALILLAALLNVAYQLRNHK